MGSSSKDRKHSHKRRHKVEELDTTEHQKDLKRLRAYSHDDEEDDDCYKFYIKKKT